MVIILSAISHGIRIISRILSNSQGANCTAHVDMSMSPYRRLFLYSTIRTGSKLTKTYTCPTCPRKPDDMRLCGHLRWISSESGRNKWSSASVDASDSYVPAYAVRQPRNKPIPPIQQNIPLSQLFPSQMPALSGTSVGNLSQNKNRSVVQQYEPFCINTI